MCVCVCVCARARKGEWRVVTIHGLFCVVVTIVVVVADVDAGGRVFLFVNIYFCLCRYYSCSSSCGFLRDMVSGVRHFC